MKENNHVYAIRYDYDIENDPAGYTTEQAENKGLCDAMVVISIIKPNDGSYSQMLMGYDGKERRHLTQDELFKVWSMLGVSLYDTNGLKGLKHTIVEDHTKMMRSLVKSIKELNNA